MNSFNQNWLCLFCVCDHTKIPVNHWTILNRKYFLLAVFWLSVYQLSPQMILWHVKSIPQFTLTLISAMNQTNCPSCQNHLSTVTSCVMTDAILEHISHVLPEVFRLKQSVRSITRCSSAVISRAVTGPVCPPASNNSLYPWLCHTAHSVPSLPPFYYWQTEDDREEWLELVGMVQASKSVFWLRALSQIASAHVHATRHGWK